MRVVRVDGAEVRKKHPDFNNLSWHNHHDFVPEGEMWVDSTQDISREDVMIFAARVKREMDELEHGLSEKQAFEAGEKYEQEVRAKMALVKSGGVLKKEKKLLMTVKASPLHEELSIFLIDPEPVKVLYPSFTMGGHPEVYSFIPKGEIWIDSALNEREAHLSAMHEYVEFCLMLKGVSYDDAHEAALRAEAIMTHKMEM